MHRKLTENFLDCCRKKQILIILSCSPFWSTGRANYSLFLAAVSRQFAEREIQRQLNSTAIGDYCLFLPSGGGQLYISTSVWGLGFIACNKEKHRMTKFVTHCLHPQTVIEINCSWFHPASIASWQT